MLLFYLIVEQLPIHKAFSNIPAGSSRIHYRHLESIKVSESLQIYICCRLLSVLKMKALISRHPETAALPDGDDNLPLHLAVYYNSSFEVIETIYNVYPSGALGRDLKLLIITILFIVIVFKKSIYYISHVLFGFFYCHYSNKLLISFFEVNHNSIQLFGKVCHK